MKQYVYCYENPVFVGNSKHIGSNEVAKFISKIKDFELDTEMSIVNGEQTAKEKEVEMDLRFLECPEFMGTKV
jgi:hypothetical protein